MGTGKVTVEHLGLKDCPRCEGTGDIEGMEQQDPFGQPDPNGMQPQTDPNGMQPNGGGQDTPPQQNGQQPPNGQPQQNGGQQPPNGQPQQNGQQPQPTFSEPGKDDEQPVQNMAEPQQEQPQQKQQPMGQDQKSELERPFEKDISESLKKKLYECNGTACPKSIKQYEGFIKKKIQVLQGKRRGKNRAVEMMFGLPTIEKSGKRIKGTLAYAGVSLNNRIYLPEELAKGHDKTLPLLLNHSNVAGAEEELDRLDDDMRGALENQEDFQIGWVTLRWEPEELTLYYEGVIEHEFFQKEVDDADMAVSLGIWYDSDSPQVCDEECYTLIRGAEFREVSLVYHPGFPIATIEAVEVGLRVKAKNTINEVRFDHYANNIENAITVSTATTPVFNNQFTYSGANTPAQTVYTTEAQRDYRLQPAMSLPKTTGDLKIPPKPKVVKPEDSIKDKKEGNEDAKKKLKKSSKKKSTQEKKAGNSQRKGQLRKKK